jgi:hypothetical protein
MMTKNSINMREDRLKFTPLPGFFNLIGGDDNVSETGNSETDTDNDVNSENSEKVI